jgi:uncharacterized protein YdaL
MPSPHSQQQRRARPICAAIFTALTALAAPATAWADDKCVQVFYDRTKDPAYHHGRTAAIFLENLLGHFREFRTHVAPIEDYAPGQIERCSATFYIGTYFDNAIPEAFLEDFATTERRVAWLGYSIWQLKPQRLERALGIKYLRLTTLDTAKRDAKGRPTFYRQIAYKGETFEKYGEFRSGTKDAFDAPFEMAALEIVVAQTEILATAIHNGDGSRLPYAVRSRNRFYVADVPFSFTHESDRYLVFADLLFDILDAPPRRKKRYAVLRIEDVSANTSPAALAGILQIARPLRITPHIALIPVFADPFGVLGQKTTKGIPIKDDRRFQQTLRVLQRAGARFIWHGVTHQLDNLKNPKGVSGYDFEFWNVGANAPAPGDSARFVLDRLDEGWRSMGAAGIRPKIWEVPHYACSATDYLVFARVFSWNIGRIRYLPFVASGLPASSPPTLWYEATGLAGRKLRRSMLGQVSAATSGQYEPQFFPFEIYRDVYGQAVLPENLGFVDYLGSPDGVNPIDVMLANAKRNRVLRDNWASFYFHPFFMQRPGAAADLDRLLKGLQALGYEFVDLERFIERRRWAIRR